MTLYEKVERLCKQNGINISNLGDALGIKVDKSTISHWKKGAVPRASTIKVIADYFGVTPEYLLGWSQDEYGSTTEPKKTKISPDEAILLQEYRKYPIDEKQNIIGVVRNWDKIKSFFVK